MDLQALEVTNAWVVDRLKDSKWMAETCGIRKRSELSAAMRVDTPMIATLD